MIFEQIVVVDETGLTPQGLVELQSLSKNPLVTYPDYPASDDVIMNRIRPADCVLVSWNTQLTGEVLQAAERLKYVGMCCSLYDAASANVDIAAADAQQITVRGVRDYGDDGVVEFIMAELIYLYKGLGQLQWGPEPAELTGKILGVIGFGTTGQMVARAARSFGMHVRYYSRTRRPELEDDDVRYASLHDLLEEADVVTTHLPKRTYLLGSTEFNKMKTGAIFVNTSLGPTFDVAAFSEWIGRQDNYAIFDADGVGEYAADFSSYSNVLVSDKIAGWTTEARARLTEKVLTNIRNFLAEQS